MKSIARIVVSGLSGAVAAIILSAAIFTLGAVSDGTRLEEAVAFSIIIGLIAAFFGALIGLAVGIGKLGVIGGGISGLLATAALVAIYVLIYSRPGQYGYFLRGASPFLIVFGLPMILAGIITALLRKALNPT